MADENQMPQKRYIGDSVYASFDGEYIWLETDNGFGASNRIALDDEVLAGFDRLRAEIGDWRMEVALSRPMSPVEFQREYLASPVPKINVKIQVSPKPSPSPDPLPEDGRSDGIAGQRLQERLLKDFEGRPMTIATLTEIASRTHKEVFAMAGGRIMARMLVGYEVDANRNVNLTFYATHPSDEVLRGMGFDVFSMNEAAQDMLFLSSTNTATQGLVMA